METNYTKLQNGEKNQLPLRTEKRKCPLCTVDSTHNVYKSKFNDRETIYRVCLSCGNRWDGEYTDKSINKKGQKGQVINNQIWGWIKNNHDDIFMVIPEQLHITRGKVGHKRRHKGKAAFGSEFHPDFWRLLNRPQMIIVLSRALEKLQFENEQLYSFIFLKSLGFTYGQIGDFLGIALRKRVIKNTPGRRKGKRIATQLSESLNSQALNFILSELPKDIKKYWAVDNLSKRHGMVICPSCNGGGDACSLCQGLRKVGSHIARIFTEKTANGTWIDKEG